MKTMKLTPAILRALGEGVSRLEDGDCDDCAKAEEIRKVMGEMNYALQGYSFVDLGEDAPDFTVHIYPPNPINQEDFLAYVELHPRYGRVCESATGKTPLTALFGALAKCQEEM